MLKPLGDKVVVKMVEAEEVTKGGIVIPNTAKEKSQIAEVVCVGDGENEEGKKINIKVKTGDKVVINKYSGTEIKYLDEEYLILSQKDILAIVE